MLQSLVSSARFITSKVYYYWPFVFTPTLLQNQSRRPVRLQSSKHLMFGGDQKNKNCLTNKYRRFTSSSGVDAFVCNATVEPYFPLPEQHNILRPSAKNNVVCLEGDGILKVTVKFQISDKKTLGVKTKGRQFSVGYKVECKDLKEVLNVGLNQGFLSGLTGNQTVEIGNITQIFKGTFNGVPLTVSVTRDELDTAFNTTDDRFIKVLSYKFFNAFREWCSQRPNTDRFYSYTLNSEAIIDLLDWEQSEGLWLVKTYETLFGTMDVNAAPSQPAAIPDLGETKGRFLPEESIVAPAVAQHNVTTQFFNGFTNLPIAFTLIEGAVSTTEVVEPSEPVESASAAMALNALRSISGGAPVSRQGAGGGQGRNQAAAGSSFNAAQALGSIFGNFTIPQEALRLVEAYYGFRKPSNNL
jgi:hypothetical protein